MHFAGIHHIALYTPNLAGLEAFYTQTLGFPVVRRWDAAGIVFVDAGGVWLELTRLDQPSLHAPPHSIDQGIGLNHIAFRVTNIDITFEELVRRGVQVLAAPSNYEQVRVAFFADPDGNVLELIEESGNRPQM
jgi:catechol 2,3-dioxygenase-like lactoylglutathione lyase family enzyme